MWSVLVGKNTVKRVSCLSTFEGGQRGTFKRKLKTFLFRHAFSSS